MDVYLIWFNLRESHKDLEVTRALGAFLGELQAQGAIEGWRLLRRKLGFGPHELGEFQVALYVHGLAQLDRACDLLYPRKGGMERLHAGVWARVTDVRAGLYRDFPDPERLAADPEASGAAAARGGGPRP